MDDRYSHIPWGEHQTKALRQLANGKILRGGTGSGKTRVAVRYYLEKEAPKDVYVITTARKRDDFDWQNEFYKHDVGPRTGPQRPGGVPGNKRQARGGNAKSRRGKRATRDDLGNSESSSGVVRRLALPGSPDIHDPGSGTADHLHHGRDRAVPTLAVVGEDASGRFVPGAGGGDSGDSDVGGRDRASDGQPTSTSNLDFQGGFPWVVTVDSWNNIGKYADVKGAFFILDEQRLVGSGDWSTKFLKIAKNNNWILLSATPGDTWMDYVPVFIANNFYRNRTEFKREHVVYNTFTKFPKVDRYINVGKLARLRAQLLVEMPVERHTRRRPVEVLLPYDQPALEMILKKRWHIYENRPLRDVSEMFSVARRLVNSDPSRIEMVQSLWMNDHPKLIVFYNFDYELALLRCIARSMPTTSSLVTISNTASRNGKLITSAEPSLLRGTGKPQVASSQTGQFASITVDCSKPGMLRQTGSSTVKGLVIPSGSSTPWTISEWNGHKHEPIPTTDRWLYLVQYRAGAEAWDCVETDAMVFYSQNYSWKDWQQAHGRTDRLNTPFTNLWYYNFISDSWIDRAIQRSLKAKHNFNESKYKGLFAA